MSYNFKNYLIKKDFGFISQLDENLIVSTFNKKKFSTLNEFLEILSNEKKLINESLLGGVRSLFGFRSPSEDFSPKQKDALERYGERETENIENKYRYLDQFIKDDSYELVHDQIQLLFTKLLEKAGSDKSKQAVARQFVSYLFDKFKSFKTIPFYKNIIGDKELQAGRELYSTFSFADKFKVEKATAKKDLESMLFRNPEKFVETVKEMNTFLKNTFIVDEINLTTKKNIIKSLYEIFENMAIDIRRQPEFAKLFRDFVSGIKSYIRALANSDYPVTRSLKDMIPQFRREIYNLPPKMNTELEQLKVLPIKERFKNPTYKKYAKGLFSPKLNDTTKLYVGALLNDLINYTLSQVEDESLDISQF